MYRGLLVGLLGLLLIACGDAPPTQTPIVIVVTATTASVGTSTRAPPTATVAPILPPATITPDTAATAGARRQAQAEAAHATMIAAAFATATEAARPTETPVPSATPRPGIGSTLPVGDWFVTLRKTRSRATLVYNAFGSAYKPSGRFWLIYLDAQNLGDYTESPRDTLRWGLVDDHNSPYDELWTVADAPTQTNLSQFINAEGGDPLYAGITPRGKAHLILIFDVAADAQLAELAVQSQSGDSKQWDYFDLH